MSAKQTTGQKACNSVSACEYFGRATNYSLATLNVFPKLSSHWRKH